MNKKQYLCKYEINGAVGMYSGIFCNPFLIWGRYRRRLFKTTLTVSFQFHHTQMDGVTPQFEGHKECAVFMGNTPEQVAELCRWLEKHIK